MKESLLHLAVTKKSQGIKSLLSSTWIILSQGLEEKRVFCHNSFITYLAVQNNFQAKNVLAQNLRPEAI